MSRIAEARARAGQIPRPEDEARRWEAERQAAADLLSGVRTQASPAAPPPGPRVAPRDATAPGRSEPVGREGERDGHPRPRTGLLTRLRAFGARVRGGATAKARRHDTGGLNLRG